MDYSMKIPKWKFEEELESLLNAASSAKNKNTAKGYLQKAWSKADGYCNISSSLASAYKRKVEDIADELHITLNI